MTKRKPPPPSAYAWRPGEPGEISHAVVLVPRSLRARYGAVADIIEPIDHTAAPSVVQVTITDRETGAIAEVRGNRVTLPFEGTADYLDRLGRDARTIAGAAAPERRPRGTDVSEDGIHRAVAELRKAGRDIKLDTIAAASGVFTRDQLRYYLRVNGRRLSDYR